MKHCAIDTCSAVGTNHLPGHPDCLDLCGTHYTMAVSNEDEFSRTQRLAGCEHPAPSCVCVERDGRMMMCAEHFIASIAPKFAAREEALDEMQQMAQEDGLYDDIPPPPPCMTAWGNGCTGTYPRHGCGERTGHEGPCVCGDCGFTAEPTCNGICTMASELISCAPIGAVAYAHPDCDLHGRATR